MWKENNTRPGHTARWEFVVVSKKITLDWYYVD